MRFATRALPHGFGYRAGYLQMRFATRALPHGFGYRAGYLQMRFATRASRQGSEPFERRFRHAGFARLLARYF